MSCGDDKYVLDAFGTDVFSITKSNTIYRISHMHKSFNTAGDNGRIFVPPKWTIFGRAQSLQEAFRFGDALIERMVARSLLPKYVLFICFKCC